MKYFMFQAENSNHDVCSHIEISESFESAHDKFMTIIKDNDPDLFATDWIVHVLQEIDEDTYYSLSKMNKVSQMFGYRMGEYVIKSRMAGFELRD